MLAFYRIVKIAFIALFRNPMRAMLTMLGIVIGISSVIAMNEIGEGASSQIKSSLAGLGANNIIVRSSAATMGGVSLGAGSRPTLKPSDCDDILRDCSKVKYAAPTVRSSGQLSYLSNNWTPEQIVGSTSDYLAIRDWELEDGENFTEYDLKNRNRICLIGQTIKRELFPDEVSPIGKEVRINNNTFRIIGVLAPKGSSMFGRDQDDIIICPWTTIKFRLTTASISTTNANSTTVSTQSSNADIYPSSAPSFYPGFSSYQTKNFPVLIRFTSVDEIVVVATSSQDVDEAMNQINVVLRRSHKLHAGQEDDFSVRSMAEISNIMGSTSKLMTQLLLCVAFVSLIVGGVGIMNIMLVSVTERTREIGLRMAVGAREIDILMQFIVESIVLCLIGGCIGVLLGHGGAVLISNILRWPIAVSWIAIFSAVLVSAIVGIIFGFYPAWKASKLNPIEALRYE